MFITPPGREHLIDSWSSVIGHPVQWPHCFIMIIQAFIFGRIIKMHSNKKDAGTKG
jgi:hypothetical protein